ncbi:MAG: DNA methyltransferase [Actinomycetota bacterium]
MAGRLQPKRPPAETAGAAHLFPYYAGFSYDWARSQLLDGSTNGTVLDPWNGSGTTTSAASELGWRSVGVDLNPVAAIIATARSGRPLGSSAIDSISCKGWKDVTDDAARDDPLGAWFDLNTTKRLRTLARRVSALGPLATVALFRTVRGTTGFAEGSNPTWVRRGSSAQLLCLPSQALEASWRAEAVTTSEIISDPSAALRLSPLVITAAAQSLPLPSASVDTILTSPPYLTRIDYGVAYSRELALLSSCNALLSTVRRSLMGTTLIRRAAALPTFGVEAQALLDEIQHHPSKDSSGYYLKQARQYLSDLGASLSEITRVARAGASATFVVQDSYYKDIPVKLGEILVSELSSLGWDLAESRSEAVSRSLVTMNSAARRYSKKPVEEHVLRFRTTSRGSRA